MRVVASFVVLFGILAACGGAAETNLFDESPNATASSGSAGTSGNGSTSGTSGGASGTSGASGASGTSGVGSTSGAASSGVPPTDAGGPTDAGPQKCNVNAPNACLPTQYCKTEACGVMGICASRPDQTQDLNPVCGCDHTTYWNASIAASHGVNTAATGACGATGTTCTRNTGCAGDGVCDLEQTVCSVAEAKGTCWQLPKTCEGTNSRQVRRCTSSQCTSLCLAIADERQFVAGVGCP